MEVLNINNSNTGNRTIRAASSITLPVGLKTKSDVRVSRFKLSKGCIPIMKVDPSCGGKRQITDATARGWLIANRVIPTGLAMITFDAFNIAMRNKTDPGTSEPITLNPYCNLGIISSYQNDPNDGCYIVTGRCIGEWAKPDPEYCNSLLPGLQWQQPGTQNGVSYREMAIRGDPIFSSTGFLMNPPQYIYDVNELCQISATKKQLMPAEDGWNISFSFSDNTLHVTCNYSDATGSDTQICGALPTIVISRELAELIHPGVAPLPSREKWESGFNAIPLASNIRSVLDSNTSYGWYNSGAYCILPIEPKTMSPYSQAILSGNTTQLDANIISELGYPAPRPCWATYDIKFDVDTIMPVEQLLITSPDMPITPQRLIINNPISSGSVNPSFLPILKSLFFGISGDETSDFVIVDDSLTTLPTKCAETTLFSITIVLQYLMKDNSLVDCLIPPGESFSLQLTFCP